MSTKTEAKLDKRYLAVLKKLEWRVTGYYDDGRVEISNFSPQGEEILVCVETKDFPHAIREYWENFDADEHVEELIIAKNNGFQGVPPASVLVRDAEKIDKMLDDLARALEEAEEASR